MKTAISLPDDTFERPAMHTDLAVAVQAVAPLGSPP
jgi:hypothetical protein